MKIRYILFLLILVFSFNSAGFANPKEIKTLYFYVDGCSWCKKLDQILKDKHIKKIISETEFIKINIKGKKVVYDKKTEEELTRYYHVKGVPTLVFVNQRWKEVFRVPGLLSKEDLKDVLCTYIAALKRACKNN